MAEATLLGTLAFAASTGVATFFAPCAFPLLPGYVGYYLHESDTSPSMVAAAGAAGIGALGALAAIAALALAIGRPLTAALPAFEPLVGVGLVAVGVAMLLARGPEVRIPLSRRPGSVVGFGLFGAVYAVAAAGCVVPLLLAVLGQALTLSLAGGVVVLGVYALGVALPLVGVTLLAGVGVDAWQSLGSYTREIQRVAAVLVILAGLGQLYLSFVVLQVA
jgi:cytochrome c-type biogenesis protein